MTAPWHDPKAKMKSQADQWRLTMVKTQLAQRGIKDRRVLDAFKRVPRHLFGNFETLAAAYADSPQNIDCGQTISQPYMVAWMTQLLMLCGRERVLEIGTGSGFQTAILAELAAEVYTIERHEQLADAARERLEDMGYRNIRFRIGDGNLGWPEAAPFERILVTAAASGHPETLQNQLSAGQGLLLYPFGPPSEVQELVRVIRTGPSGFHKDNMGPVRFVPLVSSEQTK